jgi:hypothetical protein
MSKLSIVCLVALVLFVAAQVDAAGELIVNKKIENSYDQAMAASYNYTVDVDVFNVGDSIAYEVSASDDWPAENFEIVDGESSHVWDEIAAGEKVSYKYIVSPIGTGEVRGFRAEVEFQPEKDGEAVTVFSNPMNSYKVYEKELFEQLTSKQYVSNNKL